MCCLPPKKYEKRQMELSDKDADDIQNIDINSLMMHKALKNTLIPL